VRIKGEREGKRVDWGRGKKAGGIGGVERNWSGSTDER
jgi:hypothetical protein